MANASNDFAALARQYWDLWGDALRGAAPQTGFEGGLSGVRSSLDDWMRQAGGQTGFGGVLEHFNRQSRDWFAQMQQVAAQFAGRDHRASDVAQAWRDAFGTSHPFDGLLQGMRGPGLENFMQWSETTAPWLAGMRSEAMNALGLPAFGFAREHQERLQALGKAQIRMQEAQDAYATLLSKISKDAFDVFELKLAEREEPGRQITSVRALFDLWVDAAEEAWAENALSKEYLHVFGDLANAQMQLRAAAQAIGEQSAQTLGMPGRTELDSAHRKIAELERQLRRVQRSQTEVAPSPVARAQAKPAASKVAVKKAVAKKAVIKKPAAKKTVAKKAVKPAVKALKSAANKSATRKR